jgi:hypothetical protein
MKVRLGKIHIFIHVTASYRFENLYFSCVCMVYLMMFSVVQTI